MPRLFIAIDLPELIRDEILFTYQSIPRAKWVKNDQIHLTLRFIGDVENGTAERICHSLCNVHFPAFELSLKSVGVFPPRRQPRVLWFGLAESEPLVRFQNKIERAVIATGVAPENRKFSPHITIARLKNSPPDALASYISRNSLFKTESFCVSEFYLYSSFINSEGATHIKEATFSLETE